MARRVTKADTPATSAARLTIDLGALAANWRLLRDRAAPAECAAVIKADAYGIGIEEAVPALWRAGCRTFFVAHLDEAARARAVASDAVVYVLNGVLPGSTPRFVELGVRPILGSFAELADWASASDEAGERLPAAIHVDTGMNRLGFSPEEAEALSSDPHLIEIGLTLLMSHLASAEDEADPATACQTDAFARLLPLFPGVPTSLANSSGIFREDVEPRDLVRPGYALYGGNPVPGRPNPMQPVVRLEAPVVQVRDVPAGARAGYNGRWTAPAPRRLATLSIGYADGFLRSGSGTDAARASNVNRAVVLLGGHPCPVVGSISMDLTIVDATDAPQVRRGDLATVVGDTLDLDTVGVRAGTIGYEILTSLGRRYARRYVGT